MKQKVCMFILIAIISSLILDAQNFIEEKNTDADFPIVTTSETSSIYVDSNDDWLIHKAASLLRNDIEMVTGKKPELVSSLLSSGKNIIIIGTINGSSTIKKLIAEKKLNVDSIKDKWESSELQTINSPVKGIQNALVIVGSDKRGAAYGTFTLSEQIGVSPRYWWADVPVKKKRELFIKKGIYQFGPPSVKYRGIFINDKAPAFSGWTKEKFGGVNHWRKGIKNMDHHENIVTIGMRGNGDIPMTQGTAISLLERIVDDQRKIIEDVTGNPASETTQDWALYKEVQN